ncbi:MAG: SIR2 family protein [Bacteroidetes bacterium]|nr:SIR2 family protein [Bacteroidota bacterium]
MEENNLVPLITNLATRNRHYVVFAGAGLSIDAGVMSGWEILIETLKPLYLEEKKNKKLPNNYFSLIDKWYSNHKKYSKMDYSEILELVYEGDLERKGFLKDFFIDAKPGESHRQLAQMVSNKLVRFIFTTNFDDLIEKALEEIGINDYDIIYTNDQLEQSYSWDKVRTCRIYKLHGHYKIGKIRNTIQELETLEELIADDFQYIIDRHGIILIGYAGRDKGVMEHFLERSPYPYPFYWQYKGYPEKNKEFKLFHKLVDKYKNEHGREIHFIQDDSASDFIRGINDGLERHDRYIIASDDSGENYEEYIIKSSIKKIRAMTILVSDNLDNIYVEHIQKENQDRHYSFKYDIFTTFIYEIRSIFEYLNALLIYNEDEEALFLIDRIMKNISSSDWEGSNEFIVKSTPYYLTMIFGVILLKNDKSDMISKFFKYEYRRNTGKYHSVMKNVSYFGEGWKFL